MHVVTQRGINNDFIYTFNVTQHRQFNNKNYVFVKKIAQNQRPKTTWIYKRTVSVHFFREPRALHIHVPYTAAHNMSRRVKILYLGKIIKKNLKIKQ